MLSSQEANCENRRIKSRRANTLQGKSFLTAVFLCVRAILYPGSKLVIASGTRGQSINVLEKIRDDLMPRSPYLRNEIAKFQVSNAEAYIKFHNGSIIKVVTASDTSRSNRANILIVDEFRLVSKSVIDDVLKKFLTTHRLPPYLKNPKYAHLKERNKEIYLSSAYTKDHWSYQKVMDFARLMTDDQKKHFVCGLPYQLSIEEDLLSAEAVADEMAESNFSAIKWSMEMEAAFWGDADGSFFDFDSISKNRKLQYPMLPDDVAAILPDKRLRIQPKQPGEKRILTVDIALMSSKRNKNDAAALFIDQLIPMRGRRYSNNIVYTETHEGMHTADLAMRIRKLFDMYDCDYIVIDGKGAGMGVCDTLVRDIVDTDTGELYPALSCCNNSDWADRCKSPGAQKALWIINNQTAQFNSDCAILLREGFSSGRLKLLVTEFDAESYLGELKGYNTLDIADQTRITLPYVNTTLLINEMINLQHETSGGLVKIREKSGYRKDRYSSLSYGYWVSCQLESQMTQPNRASSSERLFLFRAPKIK